MSPVRLLLHYFFIGLLFLSVNCSSEPGKPAASQVEIVLPEILSIDNINIDIGEEEKEGDEPILASVSNVTTDAEGNIYIYDNNSYRIVKYDRKGNFLISFGRQGGGPGEFESVSYIYADQFGRLIVADRGNSRISVFDENGNMLMDQPQFKIRYIQHISEIPGGRFLISGWHPERKRMVHIMNANFSGIESSLVSLNEITKIEDEQSLDYIRNAAGYAVAVGSDRIVFIPGAYNGRLHFYESVEDGLWKPADSIAGIKIKEDPLRESTSKGLIEKIPPRVIKSIGVDNQSISITYRAVESRGIYNTSGGELVHFYYRYSEENTSLVMENFDVQNGRLLQYGIQSYSLPENILWLHWMDPEGAVYMNRGESVRLVKMSTGGILQN